MHTPDELERFATWERESWELRADAYAASLGTLTRGSVDALLDAAGVGPETRLLDVGTGPGFVALAALERGAHVRAVDQAAAMVAIARREGIDAHVADVEHLPYADSTFDAVVAGYLLNHLAHPERAVAELTRVLAPGGRLAMTVWDLPERNVVTGLLGSVVTNLGLRGVVPPGPDSKRFADEAELRRLLADLDDVEITHPTWDVRVEPGAWFDALAAATPRTGAVLAQAGPGPYARARREYVALALERYGDPNDPAGTDRTVVLSAAAVLVSGRKKRGSCDDRETC